MLDISYKTCYNFDCCQMSIYSMLEECPSGLRSWS